MSKKGIYAVDPGLLEREYYESVEALAGEICDYVTESGKPATLQTTYSWWANAVVSPYVGGASNWSIGFQEDLDIDKLIKAIKAEGLFVSCFAGYVDWMIIDTTEHEDYSPLNCILPE